MLNYQRVPTVNPIVVPGQSVDLSILMLLKMLRLARLARLIRALRYPIFRCLERRLLKSA